ncbi:hypothetical protein THTE_1722 [Thermogutta terrifontis]|uniref:Uncharacterized protein n=2 Tax=Thermogutta terrifontis TaxID=1331910 RepID=A0A286RED0_9BACT|nr:hypothetical protein THTE_1722 [Thermogutta terrifontis]
MPFRCSRTDRLLDLARLQAVWLRLFAASWALLASRGFAQNVASSQAQTTLSVQGSRMSEGFFEYSGTSWTLIGPRGFVRFGSPSPVVSPLVSFGDPGAGLGMGFRGGGVHGQFFGQWSQGYRRSFVAQSMQITLPNGSWGTVGDQAYTPFVIGFVPVVGDCSRCPALSPGLPILADPSLPLATPGMFAKPVRTSEKNAAMAKFLQNPNRDQDEAPTQPGLPNETSPLQDKNALVLSGNAPGHASAEASRGVVSTFAERVVYGVDEARWRREQELARENEIARSYLSRAETALQSGKVEVAKTYLRLAVEHASGTLREEAARKLQTLEQTGKQ